MAKINLKKLIQSLINQIIMNSRKERDPSLHSE